MLFFVERSEDATFQTHNIGSRPGTKLVSAHKLNRISHQIRPKLAHLMLRLFRTFLLAWIFDSIIFKGGLGIFLAFHTFWVAFRFITLSLRNIEHFHFNQTEASAFSIFAYRKSSNLYQIRPKLARSILRLFCTFCLTWPLDSIMLRGSFGVTSAFTSFKFRSVSLRSSDI